MLIVAEDLDLRLFAAGLQLQSTLRRLDDRAVRERVEHAGGDLDETVREIRTAIFDLHTLDDEAADSLGRRCSTPPPRPPAGPALSVTPVHPHGTRLTWRGR